MDGIETKVFCPKCRNELSLLLEKQETSGLEEILKMMNVPIGDETIYAGSIECSCGKTVRIRFSIETATDDKQPKPKMFIGGVQS
jgi:hypothetical protein